MLKELELSGFKSFAKKTELNFKSQITAIVGPNGSGKSNVAEAFRFCLGEQSMKSMRGKRGEDLIWNGSNHVPKSNRARVKLSFDNNRKLFNIDFDEISVERAVNRDGSNEYLLNGSQVRLKDVFEILAAAHVGTSGHQIISQGEADRILAANMRERREIIEDALGIKIFQYKRAESERKLERTEENIKQIESLRREIAPHIKFLKKQVEKIEKTEQVRKNLLGLYQEYLKREGLYIETEKKKIALEKEPIVQELTRLDTVMEEAKKILSQKDGMDVKSQRLLQIEDDIKKIRDDRDSLSREIGKVEGEYAVLQRSIDKLKQESSNLKSVPLQELENLEKEVSSLTDAAKILGRIREFINHFRNSDKTEAENLSRELETLGNKKNEIELRIQAADKSLQEQDIEYKKVKSDIEKEKDSNREAERNIFKISSEQERLRGRLSILDINERNLSHEENEWKREIQEGAVLLGTALLRYETLEIGEIESEREKQEERRREIEKMKIRLEELGVAEGGDVSKEYKETLERDQYLTSELEDLRKSKESLENLIKDLAEKLETQFKEGIEKINHKFAEFFALMFGGGEAKLEVSKLERRPSALRAGKVEIEELEGQEEIEEEENGIEISVNLPRKRVKSLEMLSGGERALTSIALLFAISQVNPPPFIILDETDAALDEANSKKYGDMIENLSKYSQLIVITHNRETMSRAGVIYGVTMGADGASRLLSIAFDEAVAVAK